MIPRFNISGMTICFEDDEAEGRALTIRWGRFVLEISFARFPR